MVWKRTGCVQFLALLRLWTEPPQNNNNNNNPTLHPQAGVLGEETGHREDRNSGGLCRAARSQRWAAWHPPHDVRQAHDVRNADIFWVLFSVQLSNRPTKIMSAQGTSAAMVIWARALKFCTHMFLITRNKKVWNNFFFISYFFSSITDLFYYLDYCKKN